jgi:hypothetical protein
MWIASISSAPIPSSAIRSRAILPDMAQCACNRDAPDARGRRRSGSAKSFTALAPTDLLPGRRRQPEGQLLNRNGLMVCIALQALGGRTPSWLSRGRRQGVLPGSQTVALDSMPTAYCKPSWVKVRAELSALPITGICQDHSHRHLLLHRVPNLLQCNLRLGLKINPFRNTRFFGSVRHPGTTLPASITATRSANSNSMCSPTNSPPPGSYPICPTHRSTAGPRPPNASPASENPCHL